MRASMIFLGLAVAFTLKAINLRYREEVADAYDHEPPCEPTAEERRHALRHQRLEVERLADVQAAEAEATRRELARIDAELRSLAPAPAPKATK